MRLQVAQVQVLTIMIVIVSLCVRRAHALQSSLVRRGSHHHHHHHPSIIMRNSRGLVVVGVVNTKRFASSSSSSMSTDDDDDSSSSSASKNETTPKTTTVAIIGSGAVGGYYGSRLWEAGHDVKFHMRGDHYKHSKANGLVVTSVRGDVFIPPDQLQVYEDTNDIGTVDWVICALKSTGINAIPDLLFPLLTENTRVINIMNGLIEEDILELLNNNATTATAAATKDGSSSSLSNDNNNNKDEQQQQQLLTCCAAIYGGMALLCSNRIGPGRIDHSYAGLLSGGVAAASPKTNPQLNQAAFEALWDITKVDIVYEESLLRGRWKKNCWNLPFNGISVAMGGVTIDVIVNNVGLRKLAFRIMDETIAIANEDLKQNGYDESYYLGDAEKKQMMDLSDAMGPYKTSTMLDLVERRPMEVRFLFRKPLERAEKLGIKAPHLETLVLLIESYQEMYNL